MEWHKWATKITANQTRWSRATLAVN